MHVLSLPVELATLNIFSQKNQSPGTIPKVKGRHQTKQSLWERQEMSLLHPGSWQYAHTVGPHTQWDQGARL